MSEADQMVFGDPSAEKPGPRLADEIGEWVESRDTARLVAFFAVAPGAEAKAFLVEDLRGNADTMSSHPAAAWKVFRTAGPGARFVSIGDAGLRRCVAAVGPDQEVQFLPPDAQSLSGPGADDAVREWRTAPPSAFVDTAPQERVPADGVLARLTADRADDANLHVWRIGYGLLGLSALVLGFLFFRVTMDDSFITWRYGKNLVEHGVWNWNPSGAPVEAYTNPLYAVLSIVPALFGFSAELFFKIVAIGIAAAYVFLVRRARLPRGQEFVLLAVAAASPIFFLQLFMGLETVSFALLVAWLFSIVYRRGALGRGGYVIAAAVALSRPEGIVLAAVAIGWSVLIDRSRANRRGAAVVLGGWAVYWCARWWYFGSFFPNTFYRKTGGDSAFFVDLLNVLPSVGPMVLPVMIGLALGFGLYRRATGRNPLAEPDVLRHVVPVVLAVTALLIVFGVYKRSELVMDTGNRFCWQLLFPVVVVVLSRPIRLDRSAPDSGVSRVSALIAICLATAAVLLWQPGQLSSGVVAGTAVVVLGIVVGSVRKTAASVLVCAIGLGTAIGFGNATELTQMLAYRYRLEAAHQAVGEAIASTKLPGGALAIGDAGIAPYEAGAPAIDIDGLATKEAVSGVLSPAFLQANDLQLAVLLSATDDAGSAWRSGAAASVQSYVSDPARGFWSAPGAEFSPNYYLNYWIGPKWRGTGLQEKLGEVFMKSRARNDKPDSEVFLENLGNFSFLVK
ncbi:MULTISPECIES: hypothetical protein [Actinomycetes]|uniref:hypothetical protein n=1 Tax=Actinomycetes TaxID=1760 RepID=UPI0001B545F9|nr:MULTISPECIES: hypothetical protein [Actinomycetes]